MCSLIGGGLCCIPRYYQFAAHAPQPPAPCPLPDAWLIDKWGGERFRVSGLCRVVWGGV